MLRSDQYVNVDTRDVQQSLVGAGGMYASLEDLIKWERAMYNTGEAAKLRRLKGYYNSGKPVGYGAGVNVKESPVASFEHGGTSGATSTYVTYFPEYGASVTVLIASNRFHREGGAAKISRGITNMLFKRFGVEQLHSQQKAEPTAIAPLFKAEFSGKWFGEINGRMQVVEADLSDGDKMRLSFFDGFQATLSPVSADTLVADDRPNLSVTWDGNRLLFWDEQRSMGVLSKIGQEETAPIPEQLLGYFTAEALNDAVWTIDRPADVLVATSPRGRPIKLTPINGTIVGNVRANIYFESHETNDDQFYWTMIGGQMPSIKMVPTKRVPALRLIEKALEEVGILQAWSDYRAFKTKPDAYSFDEGGLNRLGYSLLGKDEREKAIAIFEMTVDKFPASINALDSLADALVANHQHAKAVGIYKRILEKDPSLTGVLAQIDQLNY